MTIYAGTVVDTPADPFTGDPDGALRQAEALQNGPADTAGPLMAGVSYRDQLNGATVGAARGFGGHRAGSG